MAIFLSLTLQPEQSNGSQWAIWLQNWRDAFSNKKINFVVESQKFTAELGIASIIDCRNFGQKFLTESDQKHAFVSILDHFEAICYHFRLISLKCKVICVDCSKNDVISEQLGCQNFEKKKP